MTANDSQAVVLPISSLKMEDRKRPASYDNHGHAPPTKRQATSANGSGKSHQDLDMPWKDDLERIQKDALLRQLAEYKRERAAAESRIVELNKRSSFHDEHIQIIDAWFTQLLDEVKLLKDQTESNEKDKTNTSVVFPSSLLFSDDEKFREHLKDRSEQIREVISHLFSLSTAPSPEVLELQSKLTKLLASEKAHLAELERTRLEKDQLEERLENASLRYMVAEKKLDRARSITAAKVEKGLLLSGRRSSGSMSTGESSPSKLEGSAGVDGGTGDANRSELEAAKREAEAVAERRKEQVQQLEAENEKLTAEVTALNARFTRLSDDDYAKTDIFKQLKAQHEDVIKRINDLEATNVQLREEAQRLQAERTAYRLKIDAEARSAIGEKESQLSRLEMDLTRIRNARDELLADQSIRKATSEQDRAASKRISEFAAAKEDQIKALELEIERIRSDKPTVQLADDIAELGLDVLRSKYQILDSQHTMLSQELSSMQSAYKKTSALASQNIKEFGGLEEKAFRLSAEKAKADQKYFAAMKAKEIRDGEVRTLRAQNAKSSEIISQLKDAESATRSLVVNLEKQAAETKEALKLITSQSRKSETQLNEKMILAEGLTSQVEELKKLLVSKDASLSTASNSLRRTEVELEELNLRLKESRQQIDKWKSHGLGTGKTEEYEALRTMVLCPVCRINFKNTVITTCGHVLCNVCVQERISSRSRKCPNCNHSFGLNDSMHVTL